MVVFSKSNRSRFLMKPIVSEYLCPVLFDIFTAMFLNRFWASIPIPPVVEKTIGVKVPLVPLHYMRSSSVFHVSCTSSPDPYIH